MSNIITALTRFAGMWMNSTDNTSENAYSVDDIAEYLAQQTFFGAGIVNLLDPTYGVVGNGTADDTVGFVAALEHAIGIAAGTLGTGGDTYPIPGLRLTRPLFVPVGRTGTGQIRLTSAIPIRYYGVRIAGAVGVATGVYNNTPCVLLIDHTGDAFAMNLNYTAYDFEIHDIAVQKSTAHLATGAGISDRGPYVGEAFRWGPTLRRVTFTGFQYGAYLTGQGHTNGAGGFTRLEFDDCSFNSNDYGIVAYGDGSLSRIRGGSVQQNAKAGLLVGGAGMEIGPGINFQGQPRPFECNLSSSSQNVTVYPNYLEAITAGSLANGYTLACYLFSTTSNFHVMKQHLVNITLPVVKASNCNNAISEHPAVLQSCFDVRVDSRWLVPTSTDTDQTVSAAYNLNHWEPPRGAWASSATLSASQGTIVRRIMGEVLECQDCSGVNRVSVAGLPTTLSADDWTWLALVIEYATDIPTGPPQLLISFRVGGILQPTVAYPISASLTINQSDAVMYVWGFKNTAGAQMTSITPFIYPYNVDSTALNGAHVSRAICIQQTDASLQGIEALSVIGMLAKRPVERVVTCANTVATGLMDLSQYLAATGDSARVVVTGSDSTIVASGEACRAGNGHITWHTNASTGSIVLAMAVDNVTLNATQSSGSSADITVDVFVTLR